jgi:hypothetical protein
LFSDPTISIIQSFASSDVALDNANVSTIQCKVNFEKRTLQPVDTAGVVFKLQWFYLDSIDDYVNHWAIKIDWPYKGIKGC